MGTNFKKFKQRVVTVTVILSALLGVSVGGLCASLIRLLSKREIISENPLYYILCALGALIIAAAVYFLHMPTDRKVAKKLDDDLALGERAQTMVEFQSEDTAIYRLQRQDTEEALRTTQAKLRYGKLWLHLIAPVLALAMLITSIAVPAIAHGDTGGGDDDPVFNLSPWQRQALIDLIEEVEASDMAAVPKTVAVSELTLLVAALDNVGRVSGMKLAVNYSLAAIYSAVDAANTGDTFSELLESTDDDRATGLGTAVGKLSALLVTEELSSLRTAILAEDGKAVLVSFTDALVSAMDDSVVSSLPEGDPLCASLKTLAASLSAVDTSGDTFSKTDVDAAISRANGEMGAALLTQSVNESMEGRITRRLIEIFGLKITDITVGQGNGSSGDKGNDDGNNELLPDDNTESEGGGIGPGGMEFASNDLIYDPISNSFIPYGEAILHYHGVVMGHINDGNADPELTEIITGYFDSLYNSNNDNDSNSEDND